MEHLRAKKCYGCLKARHVLVFSVIISVRSSLPATGTAKLLETLSPYVPDAFINQLLPGNRRQGRRHYFNAASFGGCICWRRFGFFGTGIVLPMCACSVSFAPMRAWLLCGGSMSSWFRRLLRFLPAGGQTVAIIDATDLPASTADKKKTVVGGPPN